jgi:glucose/arabinose dehydrogenase/PKD repeat protein
MATATRPDDRTRRRRLLQRLRFTVVTVIAVALLGLTGCDLRQGFHDYVVFDGLLLPTSVEFSSDGRIFVTEKRGVVKVFDGLDDTTATVVADLRTNTYNGWDRGMLGLALHPQFPAVPDVFVAYTLDALPGGTPPRWGRPGVDSDGCPTPPGATEDGCVVGARVSRLRLTGSVWDGVEHVLVEDWCQQFPSHSIGTLAFGADGSLYAGAGDGASYTFVDHGQRGNPCGDPVGEGGSVRSLDLRTAGDPLGLSGTIIRIDPLTGEGLGTNPLAASPDPNARRIVAIGLRNPFRFTIRPGTNDLWIGDVGSNTWEEINRTGAPDGSIDDFGWPCMDGAGRNPAFDLLDLPLCEDLYAQGDTVAPAYVYRHGQAIDGERCALDQGSSVTGVDFAPNDSPYPATYRSGLFFADATRGCIWSMAVGADGLPDPTRVTWFHQSAGTPVELEFGPGGELWYVDLFGGKIHRLGYSATNQAPQAAIVATPSSGDAPLTVSLDAGGSTDADPGDVLTYAWDIDGDGELDDGTGRTVTVTYESPGTRTVRVRVTDAADATDTATALVRVGTAPPEPMIADPVPGATVPVGGTVAFSGSATVPGVGALPESALAWGVDMLHCTTPLQCHRHPDVFTAEGVAAGSFTMPDHEYPAAVELRLSATWDGETATVVRRVDYTTAEVTLVGPSEVELALAGTVGPPPLTRTLPVGSMVTVSAPASVVTSSGTLVLASWSDGGAPTHEIVVAPGETTLVARYVLVP